MRDPKSLRTLLVMLALLAAGSPAWALTTIFSYQGRLLDSGLPTAGFHDFQFRLFATNTGGIQIGRTLTNEDVLVTSGLFQVDIDFGPDAFTGASRWLEISVRLGASVGAFTTLTPRQPVHPTPYAMFAMMSQNGAFATNAQNAVNSQNAAAAQTAVTAQSALTAATSGTATNAKSVAWTNVAGIPADFADGVDNVLPYITGAGLIVTNANTINVIFGTNGLSNSAARADHVHLGQSWTGIVARGLSLVVSNSAGTNVGVWGQSDAATGAGVFGFGSSTNGTNYGVVGQSASPRGVGVFGLATSSNGVGVAAQGAGSNSIALAVANGGIRVKGAGLGTATPVFVHRVAATNILAAYPWVTVINHPLCNGDPNAILFVTSNFNPSDPTGAVGVENNFPISVTYTGTNFFYGQFTNRWAVFNAAFEPDTAPMPAGASFNILVIKP